MILGDGYIDNDNYLSIQHGCKQLEYLQHKKDLLESNELKVSKTYNVSRKYCAERFNCRMPEVLKHYKHHFYPNGNKTITRHLLNQLDKQGLAIWYMDDGCCVKQYKRGYGNGRHLRLCTNCFNLEEHQIMQNYFEVVWDIKVTVQPCKRRNKNLSYCLRITGDNARKFIELVKPYIIDSMKYKIDFEYKTVSSNETPTSIEGSIV